MTALKAAWLVLVSAAAVGLSRVLMGPDGMRGAALGVGLGAVLGVVNYFITRRVRQAERPNVPLVMAGVIVSFVLLVSFILLVHYFVPSLVTPASLTALAVYLAYRAADVIELSRPPGIVSGAVRFSWGALSGADEAEGGKEAR